MLYLGNVLQISTAGFVELHRRLPEFGPTPLISMDSVARELGVRHVFVKDESRRAGLPAFKILGASWATYRAVAQAVDSPIDVSLEDLSAARKHGIKLIAATDGNHGRAVARMAKILGIESDIFVPLNLDRSIQGLVASEGARVVVTDGDYDYAVQQARIRSEVPNGLLIQDTAFEGYTEIAQWIVDGYSTMMTETEEQVLKATGSTVNFAVAPVGVESFAQSVVSYWKSRSYPCAVLTVEPDSAACLKSSLINGVSTSVPTDDTIMTSLNCGTVSLIAWPILQKGVDASVSISDIEADKAVKQLQPHGVNAGPCGAATYAALQYVARQHRETVGSLNSGSTVVPFCTEGTRDYKAPGIDS
ncbi:hypothetical protein GP486_005814 [Trichoglossum hirsutum]|uniref:Tryptophan synthase beta chain-like PALP domain-containing protein n=1 Tax=Trichoglossum hirsutum TaxID=265104 RepID=A0A9P8L8G6_9PEZI|nr:hypothetical protein GP486_005814 [Trichoglossum hirsutum]